MSHAIHFDHEPKSNEARDQIIEAEPIGLRTYTPTQAVFERSAGLFHFTADGRRLADFSSGVLVANLGHNPKAWMKRLFHYMNWSQPQLEGGGQYFSAPTLTAYNAITTLEVEANRRLLASLRRSHHGKRMEQVLWAASGSEAVQKALWAALHFQPKKDIILATRDGFHGKKGLAGAVTGNESSPDRDPRVRFLTFPKQECCDVARRTEPIDLAPYRAELDKLAAELPGRINCLITEPYLGGGGSFHPQTQYLQMLAEWCRKNNVVFILDEVQANFGRTGSMYAFETYGVEPDIVVLGKGMGNGVPVNAAVGRADVLGSLKYGEGSDTWSANPLACAATLATLDIFETESVLEHVRHIAEHIRAGLLRLKELECVRAVRGEGMVWGVEFADFAGRKSADIANDVVRAAYIGDAKGNAIHLLGPLAGNVVRVSPPLTITREEADYWLDVLFTIAVAVQKSIAPERTAGPAKLAMAQSR